MKPDHLQSDRNMDTARVMKIFARSMGNYREIRSFLSDTPDSLLTLALSMLELLPDKDLRDTKGAVLSDHLLNTGTPGKSDEIGRQNIPRIMFLIQELQMR